MLRAYDQERIKRHMDVLFDAPPSWPKTRDIETLARHFDKFKPEGRAGPGQVVPIRVIPTRQQRDREREQPDEDQEETA